MSSPPGGNFQTTGRRRETQTTRRAEGRDRFGDRVAAGTREAGHQRGGGYAEEALQKSASGPLGCESAQVQVENP